MFLPFTCIHFAFFSFIYLFTFIFILVTYYYYLFLCVCLCDQYSCFTLALFYPHSICLINYLPEKLQSHNSTENALGTNCSFITISYIKYK